MLGSKTESAVSDLFFYILSPSQDKGRKEEEENSTRIKFSPGVTFTFGAAKQELGRQILSHLNFSISMALVLLTYANTAGHPLKCNSSVEPN